MNLKRILSGVVGIPLLLVAFIFGNRYVVDVIVAVVAVVSMHEYFEAIKTEAKPIKWLGYLSSIFIAFIHILPIDTIKIILMFSAPTILTLLMMQMVFTEMKYNMKDIAYTFLGIVYIVFFIIFLAFIYGNIENGKILVWYLFIASWVTDIFAYFIGKLIGKHKFSKISPKKSLEGCIAGVVGAIAIMLIYSLCINHYFELSYSYLNIIIIAIILSLLSQIGDFAASSIKRHVNIKDFGKLIPGHGGMLDRIDSLLFISPFAYILLSLL